MLDVDKDIRVEVKISTSGRNKAIADIIIGDLIQVNGFQITQGENGKLYVVNPHVINNVYNKVEFRREVNYKATANLLKHTDRKKLVNKIIEAYAEKIDELRKSAQNMKVAEKNITYKTKHIVTAEEIAKEWK